MRLTRLSRLLAWGVVAAAVPACHDTGGSPTAQGPLAGLRYVNVVPDTGALDIRIIDIVGDAPATFGASFRTGGSPIGGAAQTSPPYQAVAAGQRHIRVFNSSADPAIAQQVHVDTTFTFEANRDYTFALRGFSRPGQTPHVVAAIQPDAPPASSTGQIAVRAWQLAPGLDPAATTPVAVPVPVVPTIESGFVGDLLVKTETDPLCTVTVSLLRDTRRATSATLVSVLFAEGRPPCGAALPTTERATITAVSTVPAAELPATGDAPGRPGGTSANRNAGPVVPVAVSAKRYRPVSRTAYCDAPR